MPRLYLQESGDTLGEITDEHVQFLVDNLEEESLTDQDYYINKATLESFRDAGCPTELMDLLEKAIGDKDDVDIAWE